MICPDCAGDLRPVSGPRCYKCGKPVNGDEEYCRDCSAHPGAFDQGRGIFLYDDRIRGFNQAELLAKELSRYAGIPVDTAILKKCHATRSQKKLDAAERKKNLQKAFQVVGNPAGMRILLIDDVYTTGSTMDVLAKLLLEKGASHVYFLTLCIGNNR